MTTKQIDLYNFIKDFALRNNYVPSFEQIVKLSGIYRSKSSIHDAMNALEENGYISFVTKRTSSRAYTVKGLRYAEV